METFELRYFLSVAQHENLHRASEQLRISPPSLSKAISRLEVELGVSLFSREGRNIRLTDHGLLLKKRAAEILALEESARLELSGHQGKIHVVLMGPEILLSKMGVTIAERVQKNFPFSSFEFRTGTEKETIDKVLQREAHLGVITADAPETTVAKNLGTAKFQTCVGPGHKLYSAAKAGRTLPVEKVLEFPFVSPSYPFLGQVGLKQSDDGWRDDKFPRRVDFVASSLKVLEELLVNGKAVAYLPDYFIEKLGVAKLEISGCPYNCIQKLKLITQDPKKSSWLNQLF